MQTTPPVEYPFTKTLSGLVEECKSSTLMEIDTQTITERAGDSVTISSPQTLSVEKGLNSVNVGQLTGAPLYTSLSNALVSLCPTPASSAYISCNTGKAYIKNVEWVSGEEGIVKGELGVEVESSTYDDPTTLNGMIKAAANTFMSSANSSNCYNASYKVREFRAVPIREEQLLCNAHDFAGVQYVSVFIFQSRTVQLPIQSLMFNTL
jgi:hypothetical protein